jgi:hypothetical protein
MMKRITSSVIYRKRLQTRTISCPEKKYLLEKLTEFIEQQQLIRIIEIRQAVSKLTPFTSTPNTGS